MLAVGGVKMEGKKVEVKRKNKRLTMAASEVTVQRLANYFQVENDTLFLKEEWGELAVWPGENGRFNFSHVDDMTIFEVMGDTRDFSFCQSYTAPSTSGISSTSAFSKPVAKKFTSSGFGCKIVLAEMEKTPKGVTFKEKNQTFITVQEDTATVSYITNKIKEKFGNEMILVSGNGLPIIDEEGTRGSKFWKVASRKVYAIKSDGGKLMSSKKGKIKKLKRVCDESSSSDSDAAFKKSKNDHKVREMLSSMHDDINSLMTDVYAVSSAVDSLANALKEVTTVSSALPLPLNVIKIVKDAFKCRICLSLPMKPPVIGTRCCNTLLGCSECINNWYSGEEGLTKTCPNCREPRGYAQTFQFKGIDEFLVGFKTILSNNDSSNG